MTSNSKELNTLLSTIKALRGEDGCPWDKRQTSDSLIKHLHSETAELTDAITNNDPDNLCEELGDLLYIIIMISEINDDLDHFDFNKVITTINDKLIRRHPHVFAGCRYENEEQLKKQWNAIKAEEKRKKSV